ncbi:ribonuclease H-like domain-containing protein [Tanacetum coccineum]
MPRFSSNDMVHNHYLDEARKKTQERDRNSKTSVMPSARFQSTADGSKPKPRSNNQTPRSLPCVFNANHDACIKKLLKEVNLRAKTQSNKTTNSNKPVDQKSHTHKPGRQIFIGHRFSPNTTSVMYEKTSPRSDLRWKPTSRIFESVGLRWIPTGKLFDSFISKVDSEPPHGSNVDIPNIHACKQTLDVSARTSINVQKEQSLDLSAVSTSRYVVPTGRIVVPTGMYVVPAGKVIIIVSPGRLNLVPTGRILSPGSDNDSDDASVHSEPTIPQQQRNIQPQIITTVSNNNAKFPYLKKDEYEVWAMKMEYWITNNDMNIWKVIQNGNSLKRTGRDYDGRVIILPPTTADEHIAVQRESKARTTLLQSIPDDHVADFHYMDDARDIWNAVKARFGGNAESKKMRKSMLKQEFSEFRISEAEGLHKGYDRMQKILSQLNQLKAKPEDEDINLKFLRALPSSWSQVALTLKTKGGLELLSFDDLYYKLKTLEVDIKGYSTFSSSQSAGPSHSAFVSTTSASKKMSYADSPSYSSSTYTAPSNSKTGSHRSGNVIEDVLQSFVADTEPEQQLAYEDFEQIEKMDLEEMDLKWQMAMLSVRVHKFEQKAGRKIDFDKKESARFNKKKVRCYKCLQRGHFARECRAKGGNDKQRYSSFKIQEIGKKEEDSKALITVDTLVDWTEHDGQSDGVIAPKEFGMIAGCDTEDAIEEGAAKIYNLITGADTKEASTAGDAGEFALMGVTSEVHNCPFGCETGNR